MSWQPFLHKQRWEKSPSLCYSTSKYKSLSHKPILFCYFYWCFMPQSTIVQSCCDIFLSYWVEPVLTFCLRQTCKLVLWQTVKTQVKCSIMLHFIRIYTVCKGKRDLQTKESKFVENYRPTLLALYNALSHSMCLYQVMMTLHFLNYVTNDAELTQKSIITSYLLV